MTSKHGTFQPSGMAAPLQVNRRRAAVLLVLLLALRLPLMDHPTPVDVDEVSFVAGLGFPAQYPVHHPGYPLWVALGTLTHGLGLEPYTAYQAWSLLASLVAPLLLYIGSRWIMADALAWWLALGFGVNPLVWFQATTALNYMAGGAVSLLVVGLCYRALITRRTATLYWAASTLAVGVSLRADLLIYLGPMVAYVAWRFRWRRGMGAKLILAVGIVAFIAVTSYLYGRADPTKTHRDLDHTIDVVFGTSAFNLGLVDGLLRNLIKVCLNLGWDFGVAILLMPLAVWVAIRHRHGMSANTKAILLLWALPIIVFLALMHVVQGYFILLLPAGYCVIGLALQSRCKPASAVRVAAVIAACSAAQFVFYPWSPDSTGFKRLLDAKIAFQSVSGLRQIDRRAEIHTPGDFWRTAAYEE